jgi:peptide deformylase
MKAHNGIGLAAPQIGLSKRMIVMEFNYIDAVGQNRYVKLRMINPKIVAYSEEEVDSPEGCLSFPGVYALIKRHKTVSVKYLDEEFKEQIISDADCLFSCCLQHECGHLDGEMFFHKLPKEKQKLVLDTYNKIKNGEIVLKSGQYVLVHDDEVNIVSREASSCDDESDAEKDDV